MSQLETVVTWTKKLESTLEKQLGAEGRGLHEKTSSVERQLDAKVVKLLRRIATIRNKSMHEDGYKVESLSRFIEDCDTAHRGILATGKGKHVTEAPARMAAYDDYSSSQTTFSYRADGMKAFFLRELAFLVAPVMLLTVPKNVVFSVATVGLVYALASVGTYVIATLALYPAGLAWLWVVLGVGVAGFLLIFFLAVSTT